MSGNELGLRLRRLRRLVGKTQSVVAAEIGVSKATYSSWETGRNEVRWHFVVPLCRSLSCTPNDMFDYGNDDSDDRSGKLFHRLDDAYFDFINLYERTPVNIRGAVRVIMEGTAKARIPRRSRRGPG